MTYQRRLGQLLSLIAVLIFTFSRYAGQSFSLDFLSLFPCVLIIFGALLQFPASKKDYVPFFIMIGLMIFLFMSLFFV